MSVEFVNVYLGLGSNLGDRHQNLKKALEYLSQRLRITNKSSVYQTEPIGNTHQPVFINLVL
jgi:2-amino-4-hydroxy-6-hydroxymethyldihydropteridine diphosphokinase